jgi:glycosyltransferase involved in cell wall biosynthesis
METWQKSNILVVICSYNEPVNILERALKSVTNQSYSNLSILLINDNPTRKIEQNVKRLKIKNIKIQQNKYNLGLTVNLHNSIIEAQKYKFRYYARLDADDEWNKFKIEKQIRLFNDNSTTLVCTNSIQIDQRLRKEKKYTDIDNLKIHNSIVHSSIMIDLKNFGKLNYNKKWKYAQDIELWLNIKKNDMKIKLQNDHLVNRYIIDESIGLKKRRSQRKFTAKAKMKYFEIPDISVRYFYFLLKDFLRSI